MQTNNLPEPENDIFRIVLNKILYVKGKYLPYEFGSQLMFEFEMGFFKLTLKIAIRYGPDILTGRGRNVLFYPLNYCGISSFPTEKEVATYLTQLEGYIQNWIQEGWTEENPKSFLDMILEWIFFKLLQEIFKLAPIYIKEKEAKTILNIYYANTENFHLYLLLKALIGKPVLLKIAGLIRGIFKKYSSIVKNSLKTVSGVSDTDISL